MIVTSVTFMKEGTGVGPGEVGLKLPDTNQRTAR